MSNIDFLHEFTDDGLKLFGVHWNVPNKDLCVVFVHGMTGNIIENYFGEVLGNELSKQGYGFLYGHNRGYSHINDIEKKDGDYVRIGAAYEIFEESYYDVDLWVKKALELGYKSIILMGHSIGSNKVVYYLSETNNTSIKKVILASPSDIVGDTINNDNYNKLLSEAKNNIDNGNPNKFLSELLEDWFIVSSKTYIDFCVDGNKADNLPMYRNPDNFEQLSKINIPILVFYGENEENIKERMNIIKDKAINSPKCDTDIISNADHNYNNQETNLVKVIIDYIKEN